MSERVDVLHEIRPEWQHDCQGKQDYDADIIRLSCRFYPRGGGFSILNQGAWQENDSRPEIKPSAIASIVWGEGAVELATANFEGDTEVDVKADVEAWAAEQIASLRAALARFGSEP